MRIVRVMWQFASTMRCDERGTLTRLIRHLRSSSMMLSNTRFALGVISSG